VPLLPLLLLLSLLLPLMLLLLFLRPSTVEKLFHVEHLLCSLFIVSSYNMPLMLGDYTWSNHRRVVDPLPCKMCCCACHVLLAMPAALLALLSGDGSVKTTQYDKCCLIQ
jgi:hypothetical protein